MSTDLDALATRSGDALFSQALHPAPKSLQRRARYGGLRTEMVHTPLNRRRQATECQKRTFTIICFGLIGFLLIGAATFTKQSFAAR